MTTRMDRDFLEVLRAQVRILEAQAVVGAQTTYLTPHFQNLALIDKGRAEAFAEIGEEIDSALAIMEGKSE